MNYKKWIFLVAIAVVIINCEQKENRYKRSSSEIDQVTSAIAAYEQGNWEAWVTHFSDTAQIYENNWHNGMSPERAKNEHISATGYLAEYGFVREEMVMEQIIDDEGRTWVNFWGLWKGTFKVTNRTIEVPVHMTLQFIDGKVVKQYGFWDLTMFNNEIQKIERVRSENVNDSD